MINENIVSIILIFIYVATAMYLFWSSKGNLAKIRVGLIAISMALWLLSNKMLKDANTIFTISLWVKSIFIAGGFVILFMHLFSSDYIHFKLKGFKIRNISVNFAMIIVLCSFSFTDIFFTKYNTAGLTVVDKAPPSSLFLIVLIVFLYTLINTVINFISAYRNSNRSVKVQILYILVSTTAFFLIAFITAALLPALFKINNLVGLAPIGAYIYIFGMSYAVIRYRLLDIDIVIKRTAIYVVIVGIITSLYTFILLIPYRFVGAPGSSVSILLMIIAAIILAITIQPLRDWLDNVTDRFFYKKKYDYYLVLERLSRELNSVIKYEEAFNILARSFTHEMHLKNVAIYLREKVGSDVYLCHKKEGENSEKFPDYLEENNPFVALLVDKRSILEAGEFRHRFGHLYTDGHVIDPVKAEIQRILDETFQGGLIIPIQLKRTLIGFMVLGEKKSGDLFTHRDLALLETLSSQLGTALENINLYEQMLNNERLTIIGTMSAGIAHEIRNPLSSIKTFIQMLPDKYDRPDFRQRFNEIVPAEIERISGITTDLLTFAKPSSPTLETVSIPQLVDRLVSMLSSQMRKKAINVKKETDTCPDIQADSQQIYQVLLNLVLNAIHASKQDGTITITAQANNKFGGKIGSVGSFVFITVEDNGIGIKRKDFSHIFEPFFTTKSEGTGLGLATCKRIVESHRGEIYLESYENKGTTFTIKLPMNLTADAVRKT